MPSLEARIRKQQSILICSGIGVILFGVWSIIRFILMQFMNRNDLFGLFEEYIIEDISPAEFEAIVFGVTIFLLIIDLLLRSYYGLSAIADGYGKYRGRGIYICVAAILALIFIGFDIVTIVESIRSGLDFDDIINVLIDITVNVATCEIVVAAIRLRLLLKQQTK